jgi:hypothetical protein
MSTVGHFLSGFVSLTKLSVDDRRAHKTRDLCTSFISDRNRRIPFCIESGHWRVELRRTPVFCSLLSLKMRLPHRWLKPEYFALILTNGSDHGMADFRSTVKVKCSGRVDICRLFGDRTSRGTSVRSIISNFLSDWPLVIAGVYLVMANLTRAVSLSLASPRQCRVIFYSRSNAFQRCGSVAMAAPHSLVSLTFCQ